MSNIVDEISKAHSLLTAGVVTDAEFVQIKARIIGGSSPAAPSPPSSATPDMFAPLLQGMTSFFSAAASTVAPSASTVAPSEKATPSKPTYKNIVTGERTPMDADLTSDDCTPLAPDSKAARKRQVSVFEQGVQSVVVCQGKKIKISKPLAPPKETSKTTTRYACRWCDASFSHAPARTAHEKTHSGPMRGQASLFDLKKVQANLNEKQQDREIAVQVRFLVNDIIRELESIDIPIEHVGAKPVRLRKDGRPDQRQFRCRGAETRLGRSAAFKLRVILEYERIRDQYPDFKSEAAALTADSFNINRSQLSKWIPKKSSIEREAKNRNKKHDQRDRKQRGKFAVAEKEVYEQFCEARKRGKRVGPRWLSQCARREVAKTYRGTPFEEEAKQFGAKRGWLQRFCARWKLSLRRKTNVKQKPIAERLPKIKRYFALLRLRLQSYKGKPGYCEKYSMWPLKNRWSLDQVPAVFFAPTSTYEIKGTRRVHIAANGTADSHRECTLQVCIRCFKDPSLPRHGQPKLVICFKGTGARIKKAETDQYHGDVIIMWDKKAWYNAKKCNEWARLAATEIVFKSEGRHLILLDNLSGQTTEEFKKLLLEHCNATVHALVAGCTDEIQVVDAGFGALIKFYAQETSDEWLAIDENWAEWCDTRLSAGRRRVLLTHWYGEGYVRACAKYDFVKNFQHCGSALTADGSEDDLVKLQGCADFTFSLDDAKRDAVTGEFPKEGEAVNELPDSDDEAEDVSQDSEGEEASDVDDDCQSINGEDCMDEYVPEDGWKVVPKYSFKSQSQLTGAHFAYKFKEGWERGRVIGIEKNKNSRDCGMFIVKFTTEDDRRCITLDEEDYDLDDIWVQIKRA